VSNIKLVRPQVFKRTRRPNTRIAIDEVLKRRVRLQHINQSTADY